MLFRSEGIDAGVMARTTRTDSFGGLPIGIVEHEGMEVKMRRVEWERWIEGTVFAA